jgi:hypothetical protein
MKSQGLQELVKTIFDDKETRLEFESNPDKVLSRFKLTEEEKKAVLKTHAKMGFAVTNSQQLEAALDPTWTWHAPTP